MAAAGLLLVLAVPGIGVAAGPDSEELGRQASEARARAAAAEDVLEDLAFDLVAERDELVAIEGRLADADARLRALDGQLALAERELGARQAAAERAADRADRAEDALAEAELELATEEQRLDDQAAMSFMHGTTARPVAMIQVLEDSEDPTNLAADVHLIGVVLDTQVNLIRRVDQLRRDREAASEVARQDREAADDAAASAAEAVEVVEQLRAEAVVVRAERQTDLDRQQQVLAALEADVREQEAVLASVKAEVRRLEAEREEAIAAEIAAAEAAAAERAAAERAAAEQAAAEAAAAASAAEATTEESTDAGGYEQSSAADEPASPPAASFGVPAGGNPSGPCPVDGAVAGRDFSNDWGYPRSGGRSHEGTDIFASFGTPVRAIANGTVKAIRYTDEGLGGLYVSIWVGPGEHWYYAHLQSVAGGLAVGAPVVEGQLLGTVGNTGNARGTPPHLHIGNYVDNIARNPYPLLEQRC